MVPLFQKDLRLTLEGDSNDYFGKGLSGGKLVVYPPEGVQYQSRMKTLSSVTLLCMVRQAVRLISTVWQASVSVSETPVHTAVVEGVGDHGCEYMTGGCVVVLGQNRKELCSRYERWYRLCTG